MGRAIYRKLGNEEALKKYGRSSFVFVGGTRLIQEHIPESNDAPDQEQVETDENNNPSSGKKIRSTKICCQFVARSGCIRMHFPPLEETMPIRRKTPLNTEDPISSQFSALTPERNRTSI